jgi:arylsulfatase A-like enzyme
MTFGPPIPPRAAVRGFLVARLRRARLTGSEDPFSPRAGLLLAAWFGLVTGLLELGLLVARKHLYSSAALGNLQMNRHYPWMIPVANLMIFGACGLILAMAGRVRPRLVSRMAGPFFVFLSLLTLSLAVRRVHPVACVVLSLGLTSRLSRRLTANPRALDRPIRVGIPIMAAVVAILGGLTYHRVSLSEGRALARLAAARPGAPNVLLIVLDTVRADRLSLYGYGRDTTPNLSRLAREGIRFDRARATAPWTLPSHASMFTGRWPHELFSRAHQPLDETYPTLAEFLRDRGYETAGFVANNYFCNSWFGLDRGFVHYEDHFDGELTISPAAALRCSEVGNRLLQLAGTRSSVPFQRKYAERINRDFLGWLSRRGGDRPFFAFLNYIDAHDPYLLPDGAEYHFGAGPQSPADWSILAAWSLLDKKLLREREITLARDGYDDCLAQLDEQLGRLLDALRERGVFNDTLVIITSDHGEHLGEHRLFGHAESLYRPEIDVPLLILAPSGIPSGQVVRETISLRDLPATVVERIGMGTDSPFPGRSLARLWDPSLAQGRLAPDPVLSEISRDQGVVDPRSPSPFPPGLMQSLAAERKVYIRYGDGSEALFDLDSDPAELRNLAGLAQSRPVLERFRGLLKRVDRRDPDVAR